MSGGRGDQRNGGRLTRSVDRFQLYGHAPDIYYILSRVFCMGILGMLILQSLLSVWEG